jgi:hypothetical protein
MILILIVSGCAMHFQSSIPLVKVRVALKYDKPYPLKTINPDAFLIIVSDESDQYDKSQELLQAVKQRFKQNGYFQLTDHMDDSRKTPTYVLNINHYVNSPIQKARNAGMIDMHEIDNICKQSDALITFVSLYDPQFFEMKHVFMIKSLSKKNFESKGLKSFESQLSKQIVSQLDKAISIPRQSIDAYLLPGMDLRAKKYLIHYDYIKAKKRLKSILPAISYASQSVPNIQKQYEKWRRNQLRNLEKDLINYYGFLLACEASEADPIKLQQIYKGYQTIITLTESTPLMKACAHALRRSNILNDYQKGRTINAL